MMITRDAWEARLPAVMHFFEPKDLVSREISARRRSVRQTARPGSYRDSDSAITPIRSMKDGSSSLLLPINDRVVPLPRRTTYMMARVG